MFSRKLAAHLAGLGWIGKSCLLVTPDNGPRVRWVTVLTDAPLKPTGLPMKPQCGECTACVDICPEHAFTGRPFNLKSLAKSSSMQLRATATLRSRKKKHGVAVCGLCLWACPHGEKRNAGPGNRLSITR